MSLEDPFFVVKDEVHKAVQNAKCLYSRWCELVADLGAFSKEEYDWTTNELRNSLRSIEWDLEDLEETISIVERNPKKFKIDDVELSDRRAFIDRTKANVKDMKEHLASPQTYNRQTTDAKPANSVYNGPSKPQDRYMRLDNDIERSNTKYIDDMKDQQQLMISAQDDQIDMVGTSVSTLKTMSQHISGELDEQAVMLDDFAHEMDTTETKMDNVMKKMAKVLHMSNDKRQWCAIGVLLVIMLIVIILFFIL